MISEWAKGYEAAIRDARTIFASRRIDTAQTDLAFADLAADAAVIDHALLNDRQRRETGQETEADRQPEAIQLDCPRRLWSLWDIMIEIKIGEIIKHLHDVITWGGFADSKDPRYALNATDRVKETLESLLPHLEESNFAVPTEYVRDAIRTIELAQADVDRQAIERMANMIVRTTEIECRNKSFFELNAGSKKYYDGAVLFGNDFIMKFPDAVFELDEAGKCFSLNRSTATVFHLMRLMEIAIRAIARCLQIIADPIKPAERNWGAILRSLNSAMESKAKSSGWQIAGDRELFESAYGSLDAVRIAWRNPTMHVENKYTQEETEHIFIAIRGFMRKIVDRLDQEGKPFA